MKLDFVKPNVETSSNFTSTLFSVGDESLIFDILRNKLYSNPIASICREIACNARDAHREAKKADLPIQITLPNILSPFYKIKDFGVGISPDRIENIYVKYGASTKREDNTLQGGYGLGAKVPLSYNSSFTIETIFNHIKYTYSCIIDETRVGKLLKLSEEVTDQGNGTEITIPVKTQDFVAFKKGTEVATRYWPVKPIIKGDILEYLKEEILLQGKDWALAKNYSGVADVKLIVDDIEYPLDINEFYKLVPEKSLLFNNGNFYSTLIFYFGIGDISLSASREQIHLDKKTLNTLTNRISSTIESFYEVLQNKINTISTFLLAHSFIHDDLMRYMKLSNKELDLTWNKLKLYKTNYISIPELDISYTNYSNYAYSSGTLYINKRYSIFLNDLKNKNDRDNYVYPKGERYFLSLKKGDSWDKIIAKYHLDALGAQFISSLPKKTDIVPLPLPKIDKISDRLIIYKFDVKELKFKQIPFKSMQDDKSKKIICKIRKTYYQKTHQITSVDGAFDISYDTLTFALKNLKEKTSIYAVKLTLPKDKFNKYFSEFKTIEQILKDSIKENAEVDFDQIEYCRKTYGIQDYKRYKNIIARFDKKSPFFQKMKDILDMLDHCDQYKAIYDSLSYVRQYLKCNNVDGWIKDNPDKKLEKIESMLNKQYPMFMTMHRSYFDTNKMLEFLISYIKLEDKKNAKN